ncbi:hypothetical protein BGX23_004212 [Mortierella sp. AD031]|nr:hypothetical protein BGX23_004212 [Mortierella sp. AD031]
MFNIPRKLTTETNISRILMDTYDLLSCAIEQYNHYTTYEVVPADPKVFGDIVQNGLTANDTTFPATIPTPPKFRAYKVSFRRIPGHYKPADVIQLFSKYGSLKEVGMYYRAHPKRKIFTQDGYVLFEKDEKQSHPELPKEIDVGPGHPIITNIVGQAKSDDKNTKTFTKSRTNKVSNNTPPAKDAQEQDAEGYRKPLKRNGKKRIKKVTESTLMEGVEPTSSGVPVTPAAPFTPSVPASPAVPGTPDAPDTHAASISQEPNKVAKGNRLINGLFGVANFVAGNTGYRSHQDESSDSDDDTQSPTTNPQGRLKRTTQYTGSYNQKQLSQQSATPTRH